MYTIRERDNVSAGVPLSRDALSLWRFRREEDRVERTASTVRLTWASCCWRLCWEWRVWCSVRAVIVSNESSRLSTWLSSALWAKIAVLMKLYWLRIVAMMLSLTDESSDASPRKASKSDLRSLSPRLRRLLMLVMADFCSFSLCLMTPNSPVLFSTSFHSGNGAFAVSNLVAFAALHLFGSFVCVVVTLALLAYTLTPRGSPWHFARIVFLFKSISYSQMSLEIWFCFSTALSILAWTADIIAKDKTAVTILYILPVRNAEMYQNNCLVGNDSTEIWTQWRRMLTLRMTLLHCGALNAETWFFLDDMDILFHSWNLRRRFKLTDQARGGSKSTLSWARQQAMKGNETMTTMQRTE